MRTCAGHWNTCKRAWRRQKKGAHHVHTSLQADCRSPAHCPSHPGLAPFPAFASILAAFLHAQGNYNALHRFLRGVITSTWGVIGYFLVPCRDLCPCRCRGPCSERLHHLSAKKACASPQTLTRGHSKKGLAGEGLEMALLDPSLLVADVHKDGKDGHGNSYEGHVVHTVCLST